jgi:hypothetical protein
LLTWPLEVGEARFGKAAIMSDSNRPDVCALEDSMETGAQAAHATELQASPWNVGSRIAFRFCFVYFGLFCLTTQILLSLAPLPIIPIDDLCSLWPIRPIVLWTEVHVFRMAQPVPLVQTGAGDRTFDWVLVFCLLIVAVLATAVWSLLDRRRQQYAALYKWFRLAMRMCLAAQMFAYGLDKMFLSQMPFPYLARLLEPFGNFSPMGVLWSSIGVSPRYEVFAGLAEVAAGGLLIFPRTTTLGTLVCLADMIQVFMLNMSYDVPVKLLSFHLMTLSLILLAPNFKHLLNFFFFHRTAQLSREPALFASGRANRIAVLAQILFGVWLVGINCYLLSRDWNEYSGHPKSPLYGIWNVEQQTIDGKVREPLISDMGRFRRVVFDFPEMMSFQKMDDTFAGHRITIDASKQTLALTDDSDKDWKASFTYSRPSPDQMTLDGKLDGHDVHMQLKLLDRNQFLLVNRGFHWVQEAPFIR